MANCSGSPAGCITHDIGDCSKCGCTWNHDLGFCQGASPYACDTHGDQGTCEDCGCDWAVGTNIKINIGDVWKDVSEIKINIGDSWKVVTEVWINIGDVWKRVF